MMAATGLSLGVRGGRAVLVVWCVCDLPCFFTAVLWRLSEVTEVIKQTGKIGSKNSSKGVSL